MPKTEVAQETGAIASSPGGHGQLEMNDQSNGQSKNGARQNTTGNMISNINMQIYFFLVQCLNGLRWDLNQGCSDS